MLAKKLPFTERRGAVVVSSIVVTATIGLLAGCGFKTPGVDTSQKDPFLKGGILALSRPVPPQEHDHASGSLLGFIPAPGLTSNLWISIKTSTGVLELMNGSTVVGTIKAEGLSGLPIGEYTVLHKQRNPLWYAPDSYFSNRGLALPDEGDRARYLRGALGEFAIFLDKELPLHCGPISSSDIGGARLEESELSKLYYSVSVGASIKVVA